jgi:hypothetical protein
MVAFHGDAGNSGVLKGLKDLDGAGKGEGEDLTGMKQITGDEDEIDLFLDGIGHDGAEHVEEICVTLTLAVGGAVRLAEVDIGGVEEF